MFNIATTTLRTALRTFPNSLTRSIHSTSSLLVDKSGGRDTAQPNMSASKQQHSPSSSSSESATSDPKRSASQPKESKSDAQDMKEAQEAMAGPAANYGQYGAAGIQEGNATKDSEEGKARNEAAKQGEK
ncbi:hypothetical protein JCM5353_008552 [Sporobolomyces roseus]